MARISAWEERSARRYSTFGFPVSCRMLATAAWHFFRSRPARTTVAPILAISSAAASPIPEVAPVTRPVFPSRLMGSAANSPSRLPPFDEKPGIDPTLVGNIAIEAGVKDVLEEARGRLRELPRHDDVPVGEASRRTDPGPQDVGDVPERSRRRVFEDVREIEGVEPAEPGQGRLDEAVVRHSGTQVAFDGPIVLLLREMGNELSEVPEQEIVQHVVLLGDRRRKVAGRFFQEIARNAVLVVLEEIAIRRNGEDRWLAEEHPAHGPPAPVVPDLAKEPRLFGFALGGHELPGSGCIVDQGPDEAGEEPEPDGRMPGMDDPGLEPPLLPVPIRARPRAEPMPEKPVGPPTVARIRVAEKGQEVFPLERLHRSPFELEEEQLDGVLVDDDKLAGMSREKRETVLPSRRDRQDPLPRNVPDALQQEVGILPTVRILQGQTCFPGHQRADTLFRMK